MPIIYEKKRIPETCDTCLYGPNALRYDGSPVGRMVCANANRREDYLHYFMLGSLFGVRCPSYYLDHNRYKEV